MSGSSQGGGGELYRPAFEAIRQANRGHFSKAVLEEAFAEIWKHPLDRVAEKYGFSEEMLTAAWEVFTVMEVSRPMSGYGDLAVLGELPVLRFLVTSGFRRLQESKIAALGLNAIFNAVHIDALDEPGRLGKQGLFERIMRDSGLAASEVLVVGDSADSEIAAGNRLGIRTVQTLRPGVPPTGSASFHVQSLDGIRELLSTLEA